MSGGTAVPSAGRAAVARPACHLRLLGYFAFTSPGNPRIGRATRRLLALLAVRGALPRWQVAHILYPAADEPRAAQSLRSALWRLHRAGVPIVDGKSTVLRLADCVSVDLHAATSAAQALVEADQSAVDGILRDADRMALREDLLPQWSDDWLISERERYRQLRLHALEELSRQLTATGRYGAAIDVGLAAVAADPLRESAHRAVIAAHLAEGNQLEALRQFERCADVLRRELRINPSVELYRMVAAARRTIGSVSRRPSK